MDPYKHTTDNTDSPISGAILCHFDIIVDNLRRTHEVVIGLFSEDIITMDEKQQLDREAENKGDNAIIRLLLQLLLKKEERVQEKFLDILNDKGSQALASVMSHHICEVKQGRMPQSVNEAKLQDYIQKLKVQYHNQKKWNTIEAIPGFLSIDLLDTNALVKPLFRVEAVDRYTNTAGFIVHQGIKYKEVHMENLEDIFDIDLSPLKPRKYLENRVLDVHNRVILCTGNPGVGKTTFCKHLLMRWTNGDHTITSGIFKYRLLFYIPVREVHVLRIVDILDGFGLVDDYCKPFLHWVLTKFADQILFILDGIDEVELSKESELWKLMHYRIYDGSTVFVTSRPEAKVLQEMRFSPKVKLVLEGTDEEGAKLYIQKYFIDEHDQDITEMLHICKMTIGDSKLLQIPMYVVFLLLSISNNGPSNDLDFHVPETLTELLSSFIMTLVNRWLVRMDRSAEMIPLKAVRHILGRNSPLPLDIQRILFLIGKLCYESILCGKYEFNSDDAVDSYLSIEDLNKTGLFAVSETARDTKLSVLHRIVHEYLAGLYVGSEQFRIGSFVNTIEGSQFVVRLGQNRLLSAVQFAVGSCPDLLEKILQNKVESYRVEQYSSDKTTDIYYEASLLGEANADYLCLKYLQLLLKAEVIHSRKTSFVKQFIEKTAMSPAEESSAFGSIRVYQRHLTKLFKQIDCDYSAKLLTKFYGVGLEKIVSNQFEFRNIDNAIINTICRIIGKTQNILTICLDQLSSELLAKVVVRKVESFKVRSWNRVFMNVPSLMTSLPEIGVMDIIGVPIDCSIVPAGISEGEMSNNRIESISLFSAGEPCVIPNIATRAILNQKKLKSLVLLFCDILSECGDLDTVPMLCQLEELILFDNMFTEKKMKTLCLLIRSCKTLKKLTLWSVFTEVVDISLLVKEIPNLTCLEILGMHIGPPECVVKLAEVLPQLKTLKNFSVHCNRIAGVEPQILKCLCQCSSLETFIIWNYDGELNTTEYTFPDQLQKALQQHHIELKIKTPGILQTWEDFLQLYYEF